MTDNFTDQVRSVLALAREEAILLRHDYIGTEHILLALIGKDHGVATEVLNRLGVDLERVREMVYASVRRGKSVPTETPLTSRAKSVLELARVEASDLNHEYVGTGHLLPALLREEKGIAAEVLSQLGVTLEDVRADTRRILGTDESPIPDEENNYLPQTWPTIDELKHSVAGAKLSVTRLAVVADIDVIPPRLLAEFMGALDELHRSWNGAGLEWEGGHVGIGIGAGVIR